MKTLFVRYLKPYLGRMLLGMSIKFAGSVMDLFLPWILAYVVDTVTPTGNTKAVVFWGFMMLLCSVLAITGNVVANRMASAVARDSTRAIRHDLFARTLYLSNAQVDAFTVPSLISRMTTDTYNMHRFVGMVQRLGIRAPILLIGGILVTLTLDPALTAVLGSVLPFLVLIIVFRSVRSIPLFRKVQSTADRMLQVVRENITGIRVIKALSKTDYEIRRFHDVNKEVMRKENKANMTMAIVNPVVNFLLNLGLVLVVLAGAYRVNAGLTEVGKIMAFLTYFTIILNAMMAVSRFITQFSVAAASANRIVEVLEAPEDLTVLPAEEVAEPAAAPHVEFRSVSFSYNKKENDLTHIDFVLQRGETLGILGPTGSGKSTIVQLLMRFYDIDSGAILLDGRDIRTIPMDELRSRFGVVFQHDMLFENTVLENISLGRGIGLDAARKAAEHAQAAAFIDAAGGYDYKVAAKGANLSGGQKQRLLIARALAKTPDILILDDSSSALDYKTDAALRSRINTYFAETTAIIVAQRISSILHADHILVLDDGKALGYGTHEELLRTCSVYKEIYDLQMGGGLHE
ncbi:MAG: ABC transporter ATP-binding protein [Clostridiales bacterium]|nr:ABC transporter ATP-binding protein [Clostridiales bacterium]